MIDGPELLESINEIGKENNSLSSKSSEGSDLDKLLESLLVIEDVVSSALTSSRGYDSVSSSPSVNDIIGYAGNLNSIIPAGFIMLHNDLTGSLKESLQELKAANDKENESFSLSDLFTDFPLGLVSLFTGDEQGKPLNLANLFNTTGITSLAKLAGFGMGIAGVVDNLIDSIEENGKFNWGTFIGENALPLICGAIATFVGGPSLGAAVYGVVSQFDTWEAAVEKTDEAWYTIQTAITDKDSEEYKKYNSLVEQYKETHSKEETKWLDGEVTDIYDGIGAWALADNLLSQMNYYIETKQDPGNYFTGAVVAETSDLISSIRSLANDLNDTNITSTKGGVVLPDDGFWKTLFKGEWLNKGYDLTNDEEILQYINNYLQPWLDQLDKTWETVQLSDLEDVDINSEGLLFFYNLLKRKENPDITGYDWSPAGGEDLTKSITPQAIDITPQQSEAFKDEVSQETSPDVPATENSTTVAVEEGTEKAGERHKDLTTKLDAMQAALDEVNSALAGVAAGLMAVGAMGAFSKKSTALYNDDLQF